VSILLGLLKRAGNYLVWAGVVLLIGAVVTLAILLRSKNKKIQSLETTLVLKAAKLKVENVLIKNRVTVAELSQLRELKTEVKTELCQLERDLEKRLTGKMTAEEIVAKLREVGLPQ
jgi:hypothetical protein